MSTIFHGTNGQGSDEALFITGTNGLPSASRNVSIFTPYPATSTCRVRYGVSSLSENVEFFSTGEVWTGLDGNTHIATIGFRGRARFRAIASNVSPKYIADFAFI
jgi:hypothetical protein